MSDNEAHQIILELLTRLDTKLDTLSKTVSTLSTEVALLKRDKAWQKYIAGAVGSAVTLVITFIVKTKIN